MILIGLNQKQKHAEISKYIAEHDIKQVIVFSDEQFYMELPETPCPIRQIGYKETIMYRTFYPLLEEIDDTYLLVMNECMRTQNRSDLTYNCIAKYTNQTPHRIVFEYFPFIEDEKDFMILLDFSDSQKHKGRGIADVDIDGINVLCIRRRFSLETDVVITPVTAVSEYEAYRDKLFAEIGKKDPDTIPRTLHIWTGKYKRGAIDSTHQYVARNDRFKLPNVTTYKNVEPGREYILVDMPHRRLDFNDFLRRTGQTDLQYLSTGFKIDDVYINNFREWAERLEGFYAKTGLYKQIG